MEVKFSVSDDKLKNFSDSAKARLVTQAEQFTIDIIGEAERVEKFFRENGAASEITDSIVKQAVRRNKTECRPDKKGRICCIVSDIGILLVGLLFEREKFITPEHTFNLIYFAVFLVVLTVAIVTTVVKYYGRG